MKKVASIYKIIIRILVFVSIILCTNFVFAKNNIVINDAIFSTELQDATLQKDFLYDDITYDYTIKNNTDNTNFYITIINPIIDSVLIIHNTDTFFFGDKTFQKHQKVKHLNDIYSFKIDKDSSTTISVLLKNQKEHLGVKLILSSENKFLKIANRDSFILGLFIGTYFLYILLLLSMYIFSKNKFFSKYMFMNIITLLIYIYFSGLGRHYIWYNSIGVQVILPAILFMIYAAQHVNFSYQFFNIGTEYKYIKFIIKAYIVFVIIFSISQLVKLTFLDSLAVNFTVFTYTVYSIFFVYIAIVVYLSINTYKITKRVEALWVLSGGALQTFSWLVFYNNIYNSMESLNYVSNLKLFESNIFTSQINTILITLEILLITIFITYNYRNIIKQNNISYNRLHFLQNRNLESYKDSIKQTRNEINQFLEKKILQEIKQIKINFKDFIFFKDINKLNTSVLNNIEYAENELAKIMHDDTSVIEKNQFGNIIHNILKKLPENVQQNIKIDTVLAEKCFNDNFNNHIQRIVEELINNSLKHSECKEINLSCNIVDNNVVKIIIKNKIKINQQLSIKKGLGLINIENRLNEIDGQMEIENKENIWTNIICIKTK
ncbi:MAG: hypothetical protein IPK18_01155 [Sphingobacteriales bacterium]|jgi:hypothetical protein|nr:MAG: hypothetical protein IPK18_01155 [Sphingobacteriales bacterium]